MEKGSRVGLTLEAVAKQAGVPRVSLYYFLNRSTPCSIRLINERYREWLPNYHALLPQRTGSNY